MTVREVARIRDISDKAIDTELPDVDNPQALDDCAELIYKHVSAQLDREIPRAEAKERKGIPGRKWQGRMRLDVMFSLWPRLKDPVLVATEQRDYICKKLYDRLAEIDAMHCIGRTTQFNPAVWWVNNHWSPIVVSNVTDRAENGEGTYRCRDISGCAAEFTNPGPRGGHEYSTHKLVVSAENKPFYFDDSRFTEEYVDSVIVGILKDAVKPLTLNGLSVLTYAKDPRINRDTVAGFLDGLIKTATVRETTRGRWVAYELASEEQQTVTEETGSEAAEVYTVDLTGVLVENIEITAGPSLVDMPLPEMLEDMRRNMAQGVTFMNAAMVQIKTAQTRVGEMQEQIEKLKSELHTARTKFMHKSEGSASGGGSATNESVGKLEKRLAEIERQYSTLHEAVYGPPRK